MRKVEWIHVVFIHIFRNIRLNFRQFCQNPEQHRLPFWQHRHLFLDEINWNFVFNCHFYFGSYVIFCNWIGFIGFSWTNWWADLLILVRSWWLPWLWKKLFNKKKFKKKVFNFAILFFLNFYLLPDLVS